MNDEQRTAAAKRGVKAIIADLTNRRGLRQEWEGIDPRTRAAIKRAWETLVANEYTAMIIEMEDAKSTPSGGAPR